MSQDTVWKTLIGHEWAVDLLRGAILNDRVGHAYLFTGPGQTGKTTLARLFAQALNCLEPDLERRPCGQCRPCTLIAADRHPDVRLLEPHVTSRGKRTLKIEAIRDLQHDLNLASYEARHKIAILPSFEAATQGAANAFLKTLEEPAAGVILLLTAVEADALLPTIASRCRLIGLRPLPVEQIAAALQERWQTPPDRSRMLAHLADGRPGWAIQAIEDPSLLEARESHLAALSQALPGRRVDRFALADRLANDAETLPELLRTWLGWWRDLSLLAWGSRDESVVNVDRMQGLQELAQRWDKKAILKSLTQTREALWQLEHNANARLVIENLLLVYPSAPQASIGD